MRPEADAGVPGAREEARRRARAGHLGTGTLACDRCDAPVALGPGAVALTAAVSCPFCSHSATVRDFLSLGGPPRPARVAVRVLPPRLLRAG